MSLYFNGGWTTAVSKRKGNTPMFFLERLGLFFVVNNLIFVLVFLVKNENKWRFVFRDPRVNNSPANVNWVVWLVRCSGCVLKIIKSYPEQTIIATLEKDSPYPCTVPWNDQRLRMSNNWTGNTMLRSCLTYTGQIIINSFFQKLYE